jgi:ParB-like nuclease domain
MKGHAQMRLRLKDLEPNPMRDSAIDPVDPESVERLRSSIHAYGFWSGTTARCVQHGNTAAYQVAGGWTRVQAAIEEGVEEAEIHIGDFDNTAMLRIYAVENATQRGAAALSVAGSVAGALRQCLRESFTPKIRSEKRGGHNRDGIGQPAILGKLQGVPGIDHNVVDRQLAGLKQSGHYDRIVREETERFEAEQAAELKRLAEAQAKVIEDKERQRLATEQAETEAKLAKAQEAKVKAEEKERPVTFDLAGVGVHLTNASHLETFRKLVTSEQIAKFLLVEQQAALAKKLVELATASKADRHWRKKGDELTSDFIKREIDEMIATGPRFLQHLANKAERKRAEEELKNSAWTKRWAAAEEEVRRFAQRAYSSTEKLATLSLERPRGIEIVESNDFTLALANLRTAVSILERFQRPVALEGAVIHAVKETA